MGGRVLNGLYPVIVIQKISDSGILSKPVPVYLDEALTDIAIVSQSRRAEFASDTIIDSKTGSMEIKQRGLTNAVDMVLRANRNSIGVNILLPLINIAFQNANLGKYQVSYFNQNVVLFRSKIINFSTEENNSNTGVNINISLAQEDKATDDNKNTAVAKTSGTDTQPDLIR